MAFSVFSKPLGPGRAGMYIGGGAAIGAGAGAVLSGRDHRTSGAVVGGALGTGVGVAVAAAHASQGTGAASILRDAARNVRGAYGAASSLTGKGGGVIAGASAGLATAGDAAMTAFRGANVEAGLARSMKRGVAGGLGLLRRLRG